jgi:Region found in RelA / SpoT proteins
MITRLFHLVAPKKEFPDPSKTRQDKRFSGYSAVHYRIQLKEQDLSGPERRYAAARIEVQVASVLMHAWAEVEHDLVYKPLTGELSEEEYAILDQLNGLVMAGEISLERLQKSGEARVAVTDRKIANHYDLAVHLLSRAEAMTGRPISDSGLGRVDLLFDLLAELKIDTPGLLAPYIKALDGNVELRPLAEQIIDALLAEDDSRYGVYSNIRARRRQAFVGTNSEDEDIYRQVGVFMTRWIELETLIRRLASRNGIDRPVPLNARMLKGIIPLDREILAEYDRLRRLRNNVVHGIEIPAAADLAEAAHRLEVLTAEINRCDDGPNRTA